MSGYVGSKHGSFLLSHSRPVDRRLATDASQSLKQCMEAMWRPPCMRRAASVHRLQLDGQPNLKCGAVTNPGLEMDFSLEDAAKLPDDD